MTTTISNPGAPGYYGWLQKTGDGLSAVFWNRRFFRLADNKINYFVDQTERELKGTIQVETIRSVKNSGGGYFQIQVPNRIYSLFADSTHGIFLIFILF